MENKIVDYFDAIESVLQGQDKAREHLTDIQRKSKSLIDEYIGDMVYDIIPVKKDKDMAQSRTDKLDAELNKINSLMKSISSEFYNAEKKIKAVQKDMADESRDSQRIVNGLADDIQKLCDSVEKNEKGTNEQKNLLISTIKDTLEKGTLDSHTAETLAGKVAEIGDNLKRTELLTVRDISRDMYQGALSKIKGRESVQIDISEKTTPTYESERYKE